MKFTKILMSAVLFAALSFFDSTPQGMAATVKKADKAPAGFTQSEVEKRETVTNAVVNNKKNTENLVLPETEDVDVKVKFKDLHPYATFLYNGDSEFVSIDEFIQKDPRSRVISFTITSAIVLNTVGFEPERNVYTINVRTNTLYLNGNQIPRNYVIPGTGMTALTLLKNLNDEAYSHVNNKLGLQKTIIKHLDLNARVIKKMMKLQ